MRRAKAVLIILIVSIPVLFAANSQKIHSVNSEIYEDISTVFMASGHSLPSSSGPWSTDELLKMISSIEPSEVPQYAQGLYEKILEELGQEPSIQYGNGAMEFDGLLNIELYAHTFDDSTISRTDRNGVSETAYAGREWWFGKNLKDITPFFAVDWEIYQWNNYYAFVELGLQNAYHGYDEIGSTKLNTNILAFQNIPSFNFKLLDVSFPQRAFASIGGEGWNIEIGRDKINWGSGETGNLAISDNFPYYDMFRATTYSEKFKYTYLLTFFPNKKNYYDQDSTTILDRCSSGRSTSHNMDGILLYSAHRFEGRFFRDKLSVSFTEAITYEDLEGQIQFSALSPLYFMHNAFIPHNSNSTICLEADWATPVRGLSLYGQILIDQGAFPGLEKPWTPYQSESKAPDARAFLAGARFVSGLGDGILKLNAEAAYVTSYAYLRNSGEGFWGLDYVAAVRARMYAYEDRIPSGDCAHDEFVIGYQYGPDCLTGEFKASYRKDKLELSGKLFAMAHGTHDRWTSWREIPPNTSQESYDAEFAGLSTVHPSQNVRYADENLRDDLWLTLDFGIGASYEVSDSFDIFVNADAVFMNNVFNRSALDGLNDIQIILGGTLKCF